MLILTHRAPVQFCLQSDGSYEAAAAPGGVASVIRDLFLLSAKGTEGADRVECIAAAVGRDRVALKSGIHPPSGIHLLVFDEEIHTLHYKYVSNSVLWYVLHDLYDEALPDFDDRFVTAWRAYSEVNHQFAEFTARVASSGETIVINDYQLALVPQMLRKLRPDVPIVHFFHTPFPSPAVFSVLPDHVAQALIDSWRATPVGFQTTRWERNFCETVGKLHGSEPAFTFVAPLGPDPSMLHQAAQSSLAEEARGEIDSLVDAEALMVLRVERLDPSKNTIRGIKTFDLLLDRRPVWRQRAQLLICLIPSRQGIEAYDDYQQGIVEEVARVNDRWASSSWQPIVLVVRDDYFQSIAALQRYDVLFVNSISDGMNLVAKEGPLLNRRNGVLCLSEEAGAFAELEEACLRVNPFDNAQAAEALHVALSMTTDERAARASKLRSLAAIHTPTTWLQALVDAAKPGRIPS